MHEVLVNRLGGLSLPRKSVVRLTDRPDMTLDVYRGRKTTMQQQQRQYRKPLYFYIGIIAIHHKVGLKPNAWPKILENVKECVLLDIGEGKNFRYLLVTELYYFHMNIINACTLRCTVGSGFILSIWGFYKIAVLSIFDPVKFIS